MTALAAPGGAARPVAGVFDAAEACRLAQNLARNCNYSVFPCRNDKRPATPHGFHDASSDPERVADLWHQHPGALIGVRTGPASRVSVLDVDVKHDAARAWWRENEIRLPLTRTFRTRGGGLHLFFKHAAGVRNAQGKPAEGIDVRGDGGYIIFWYAAGFECLDHAPLAPWLHWLTPIIWPPSPKPASPQDQSAEPSSAAIAGLIRAVREAEEGSRNGRLFWAGCRLRERGVSRGQAERDLLAAAAAAGLPDVEARRTITSAWRA